MRKLVFLMIIALAFTVCSGSTGDDGSLTTTPLLTGTVSISGIAEVGQILTVNTGSLGGSGTISYLWKRGIFNIGTDSNKYIVQSVDVGSTITVTVTRSGYTGSVTSQAIGPITNDNSLVIFNSLAANGSETQTTTVLTLTFNKAITELTANDITLSGVSGVTKGTLNGSGPTYTLPISGFTASGTLSVAVTKPGFNINGSSKAVAIYYAVPITFNSLTANGSETQTTTLILTFSRAINGLTASDITLNGVSGVQKGSLIGSGSTYTLPINGFTTSGTLNVTVTKPGFDISGSSKTVVIYYIIPTIPITFYSVTANGSETQTTTVLTLTFSQSITGLTADDITLSGISGVSKGTLSGSGLTYTLPINGFIAGGTLNVAVTKSGYAISGSPKTVRIYNYTPPTVGIVISLAGMNEWELIEQTVQVTSNVYNSFTINGTYAAYQWYLDGTPVGISSWYSFPYKPAGVYQLAVVVTNNSGERRSGRCRITVVN